VTTAARSARQARWLVTGPLAVRMDGLAAGRRRLPRGARVAVEVIGRAVEMNPGRLPPRGRPSTAPVWTVLRYGRDDLIARSFSVDEIVTAVARSTRDGTVALRRRAFSPLCQSSGSGPTGPLENRNNRAFEGRLVAYGRTVPRQPHACCS
jgi:hypothetical protein